jgi:hypothetical protein
MLRSAILFNDYVKFFCVNDSLIPIYYSVTGNFLILKPNIYELKSF